TTFLLLPYLAVYLIPEDLWYIIPAGKVRGRGSVALYPQLKRSKYKAYEEAWHLMREEGADAKPQEKQIPRR
ncbi:MAG TPA: hypothetical protein VGN39_01855, partial [Terriglobales bacterium]|nr:hypothetical protein [Terriglobales bacterium]